MTDDPRSELPLVAAAVARRHAEERHHRAEIGSALLAHAATITERQAQEFDPVSWRVEGLWPEGTGVGLIAVRKGGKSTLVHNLVRSLCGGEPLFGKLAVTPISEEGRLVIFDMELNDRQLSGWIGPEPVPRGDRALVFSLRGRALELDLTTEEGIRAVADMLRGLKAEVLIVDPAKPLIDAYAWDEWRDLGRLYAAVVRVGELAGCKNVMVVVHASHVSGEGNDTNRARGDTAFEGSVDVIWQLGKHGGERELNAFGRDVEWRAKLRWDRGSRQYVLNGDPVTGDDTAQAAAREKDVIPAGLRGRYPTSPLKREYREYDRQILEAMAGGGRMTKAEIAERAELSTSMVNNRLHQVLVFGEFVAEAGKVGRSSVFTIGRTAYPSEPTV